MVEEELDNKITHPNDIEKLNFFKLTPLSEQQRESMDYRDIDIYDRTFHQMQLSKEAIRDGLFQADRYSDPVQVLNTDYDNYLITYQCRQV